MSSIGGDATTLLARWSHGDRAALDEVVQLLYQQMHQIAAREIRGEHNLTIQPTVLVSEVYLRLVQLNRIGWNDRAHFLAMCARLTRQALVDEARKRQAAKRDSRLDVTFVDEQGGSSTGGFNILEVDELLTQLEGFDGDAARVIELRIFAGLSIEEAAAQLQMSESTVSRKWRVGKAWLAQQLGLVNAAT
jgi:RNA polymerase sigma factor (TIGR02999 family)